MDQSRQVDVATVLSSIAQQLDQNRTQLNSVDNAGTHGQRIAEAFTAAADAAQSAGTDDAGQQLQAAAAAMRAQGQGKAVGFYAQGLEHAAQQFMGQSGISEANLGSFLESFVGGIEKNNPAKPGQGTMLDALGPAVQAYTQGEQGGNVQQGIANALGAAINGTANSGGRRGAVDPGAASATNVLGGIFMAVAPQLLSMLFNRGHAQAQSGAQAGGGNIDLGGLLGGLLGGGGQGAQAGQGGGLGGNMGWLTGLLGGLAGGALGGGGGQGGAGDLGGLLGGLLGGQSGQSGQSGQGGAGDLGGLLGGLMGGGQSGQSGQDSSQGSGGTDIGGLLGGLMGGGNQGSQSGQGNSNLDLNNLDLNSILGGEDNDPRTRG